MAERVIGSRTAGRESTTPISRAINIPVNRGANEVPQHTQIYKPEREIVTQTTETPVQSRTRNVVIPEPAPQLYEDRDMAKKKFGQTVFGKILKGAAIAGGSILGLGAITGIVRGAGAVAGAISGAARVKTTIDRVGTSAVNLVTGTTKVEREQVREVKAETRAAQNQLEQVDRLIKAGLSESAARLKVGLTEALLPEYEGKAIRTSGVGDFVTANKNILLIVGAVLLGSLLLPKMMKK